MFYSVTFQFDCTNTLNDQILENVQVEMEPSESEFEVVCYVPRASLPYNTPGTTYTLVKLPEDGSSGLRTQYPSQHQRFAKTIQYSNTQCLSTHHWTVKIWSH